VANFKTYVCCQKKGLMMAIFTYNSAIDQWEKERVLMGYVQPYSAKKAAQKARLFSPWIGETSIKKIDSAAIREALIALGATGGRKQCGLSSATLRAAHLAGTQVIDWAIKQGRAVLNPFHEIPRPKANYRQSQFLSQTQASKLASKMNKLAKAAMRSNNLLETSFTLAVCIAVATGLRRGEIFALDWQHINLEAKRISVAHAVKGDGTIGRPKSASGIRNVAIGKSLAKLLTDVNQWQNALLSREAWHQADYVICNSEGGRASMNVFEHWWRKWADENGYTGLRFHELRHTHATLLIAGGADVKTVQMRLGHSSAEITMSCYAHAIPLSDGAAASSLDVSLFGR
jgi:integrase